MYLAEKQAGFKFLEVADNVSFLFVSNPPPSLPKETLSQCPWMNGVKDREEIYSDFE